MNLRPPPAELATAVHGGADLLVAPPLERRRLQSYLGLVLGDIVGLLAGFALGGFVYLGWDGLKAGLLVTQLVLPLFLTIAIYNGAYSIHTLLRPWHGIWRAELALAISSAAVIFIAFYAKASSEFSRAGFTLGIACTMGALAWMRLQMRAFAAWRCGESFINEVVIDDGGPPVELNGAIRVNAQAMRLKPDLDDPMALDRIGLVLRHVDRVVISCPVERRPAWAMMLKGANVSGEVIDEQVALLGAQGARVAAGHGLLLVSAGPLGMRDRLMKRMLDVTLAGAAVVALAPLMLLVALAIKLQDRGPVFFVQKRMGRGNTLFNVYKFRTMTVAGSDADGHVSTARGDQRITRIGNFLRRSSIDELPQLLNVLRGEMSLVGPRPHALGSHAGDKLFWEVDLRYWQRHCLKPGLSGLAQVRGFRGSTERESDLVDRLQSDLEYLEGWTILRDIKIILLTLRVLVHDRAY